MVNFRFHVVSIIAIFLAIAIGTVMGATFVGRGVIDRLQNRIDHVERTSSDVQAENDRLETAANQNSKYIDQTSTYAVGRSLPGVRVDLVAERGVDGGAIDEQADLLRAAGATVPGVVWLEESWKLDTPDEVSAMRTATGLTNRAPAPLREGAAGLLGRRLGVAPPLVATDDLLAALADAKFVTLTGASGSPTPTPADFGGDLVRTLVLGGPESSVPTDTMPALAAGMVDASAVVAVAQVFSATTGTPDRNTWIDAIANDDALRNSISTVDDADLTQGRVADVLVLAELATGRHGNYGLGRDRAVPENIVTVPSVR
jgi:hypothetical protein